MRTKLNSFVAILLCSCVGSIAAAPVEDIDDSETTTAELDELQPTTTEKASSAEVDVTTSSAVPTTAEVVDNDSPSALAIANAEVLGCSFPADFNQRFKFCMKSANNLAPMASAAASDLLKYGVLDANRIQKILSSCAPGELHDCGMQNETSDEQLRDYLEYWRKHVADFEELKKCLVKNTEGMVKMCGPETKVGKVTSGIGGLHLNAINILAQVFRHLETTPEHESNSTTDCLLKVAESVHLTSALYVHSKEYVENTVMCWNVEQVGCNSICSALASSLACTASSCPNLPTTFLKQFGIWEWYFTEPSAVIRRCEIPENGTCTRKEELTQSPEAGDGDERAIIAQLKQWREQLEHYFHQPIWIILVVFAAVLLTLLVITTVSCCWCQGAICRQRKPIRYSVLVGEKKDDDATKLLGGPSAEFDDLE